MDLPHPLMRLLLLLLPLTILGSAGQTITGSVSPIGSVGGDSRPATMRAASSALPASVLVASNGQVLYKIVVSSLQTEAIAGLMNVSGYADGLGSAALFGNIADFVLTSDGRRAYVADEVNHCVRHVDIATAIVTTFAGTNRSGDSVGPLPSVLFRRPSALTLSPSSATILYVADRDTLRIVKIDIGTGQASYVNVAYGNLVPIALTMGTDQNKLFVSTTSNGVFTVNFLDASTSLLDAAPKNGQSLCATSDGRYLFVTDADWHAVRVIDLLRGGSRWICSPDGTASPAGLQLPTDSLETCRLGEPLGIVQVEARAFFISDQSRTTVLKLMYSADFALTTAVTTRPTTTSTQPPPTVAPPPVFTPKALSTAALPPTTASVSPTVNGTAAAAGSGDGGNGSFALPLGVGLSVALLVALGFGLCIFFAVRDYRKNKNNPATPFSRAVSFAVRSFRNSFGRGRFQRDGRRPLAESNASIASSAAAAAGKGLASGAGGFDALPNSGSSSSSGVRRPVVASAGRQDVPPAAAAAAGARQQPRQQPGGSSQPGRSGSDVGGITSVAAAAGNSTGAQPASATDPPSYEALRRQDDVDDRHYDKVMPERGSRFGSLAAQPTGGPSGVAVVATAASAPPYGVGVAGRGGVQATAKPPYGTDQYPVSPATVNPAVVAAAQQQQRRPLPPSSGDGGGQRLNSGRPGSIDLYGASAASSYSALSPAGGYGRGTTELSVSPSRFAASPDARSPVANPTYGFAPPAGVRQTPAGDGQRQQLGTLPARGAATGADPPERLGRGQPIGAAHSVNV